MREVGAMHERARLAQDTAESTQSTATNAIKKSGDATRARGAESAGGWGLGEKLSENLRSIPKACAAGPQFRVPDGSVNINHVLSIRAKQALC